MIASRRNTAHDLFAEFHRHRAVVDAMETMGHIADVDDHDEAHDDDDGMPSPSSPSGGAPIVDGGGNVEEPSFDMFRNVMKTGVLYATSRALRHGFKRLDDPEWANSWVVLCTNEIYPIIIFIISFHLPHMYTYRFRFLRPILHPIHRKNNSYDEQWDRGHRRPVPSRVRLLGTFT